jgi:hypothetical protein
MGPENPAVRTTLKCEVIAPALGRRARIFVQMQRREVAGDSADGAARPASAQPTVVEMRAARAESVLA